MVCAASRQWRRWHSRLEPVPMMRRAQPWLGTLVENTVPDDIADADPGQCAFAFNVAFAAIGLIHRKMSFHDPDSDVGAINRLAIGASCVVDPHTAAVLRCALLLENASDGMFNITCADTLIRWGLLPSASTADENDHASMAENALPRSAIAIGDDHRVTRLQPGRIDSAASPRVMRSTLPSTPCARPASMPPASMPAATCAGLATRTFR